MSGAAIAASVGATVGIDVTPNPISWPNISGINIGSTGDQTITGFGAPISLEVTFTGSGLIRYQLNDGALTTIASGSSFTAHNNDKIGFFSGAGSGTVTITNLSDSSTVLATFTYFVSQDIP